MKWHMRRNKYRIFCLVTWPPSLHRTSTSEQRRRDQCIRRVYDPHSVTSVTPGESLVCDLQGNWHCTWYDISTLFNVGGKRQCELQNVFFFQNRSNLWLFQNISKIDLDPKKKELLSTKRLHWRNGTKAVEHKTIDCMLRFFNVTILTVCNCSSAQGFANRWQWRKSCLYSY